MKKIISVLLLTMYIVSNFAFTVSAAADASIYTENLFGDAYYNCDTVIEGIGVQGNSGDNAFAESVETGEAAYDNASIKLTGESRNIFQKTVAGDDLLGESVKVSLKLKVSDAAYSGVSGMQVRFYYRVQYNDGASDSQLPVVTQYTTNYVSKDWTDYSVIFDIPANGGLSAGQTCTGISFYARIGNNLSGVDGEASAWIDCISLYAVPLATDLLTTVETVDLVDVDGMTKKVELTLDTTYVNAAGFADMAVTLAGTELAKTEYTAAVEEIGGGKSKVVITFKNSKSIKTLTVNGIKDIWGRTIPVAEKEIPRDPTTAQGLVAVDGENLKLAGVDVMLNTSNVGNDCLADMEIEVDGVPFEGEYEAEVVDSIAGRKKVAITFVGGIYAKEVKVDGIKDFWGDEVDCAEATLEIERDVTVATKLIKTPVSTSDERADKIEVILNTPYINESTIENMVLKFDGVEVTTYTKTIEIDHDEAGKAFAKIVLDLDEPKLLQKVEVSVIKDVWGANVNVEDAVIEEARAITNVVDIERIPGSSEGIHAGIKLILDTPYVNMDGLSNVLVKINGVILENGYTFELEDATYDGKATKNVKINLTVEDTIDSAVVVGIKDEWNRGLNETKSVIKETPTRATYSRNLLGTEYTDFDSTALCSGDFTYALSDDRVSGTKSIKITGGASGLPGGYARQEIVSKVIPMTSVEAPNKFRVSFYVKASEDIKIYSADIDREDTFFDTRVVLYGHYRKTDGTEKKYTLSQPGINIKPNYTEWQYVYHDFNIPNYMKDHTGAVISDEYTLIGLEVNVFIHNTRSDTAIVEGYVLMDNVQVLETPADGEFLTTAITENPSTPVDGEQNAESDKVVFLYEGPVEASLIPQTAVVIKEGDAADSLKVVNKTVTFNAIYNPVTEISQVEIIPDGGFRNGKYYEVELNEAYDIWARAATGSHKVSFKVKDKLAVESAEGESTKILKDGSGKVIGAKVKVRNNDASAPTKPVVLVIAICNGNDIVDYKISASTPVAANGTAEVSATFDEVVALNEGDYVKAFVWDSTTDHRPLANIITE